MGKGIMDFSHAIKITRRWIARAAVATGHKVPSATMTPVFKDDTPQCHTCTIRSGVVTTPNECHKCDNMFATVGNNCYNCTFGSWTLVRKSTLQECNRCPNRYFDEATEICQFCPDGQTKNATGTRCE